MRKPTTRIPEILPTIRQMVTEGPLEVVQALDYAIQAAEGLGKAHGLIAT